MDCIILYRWFLLYKMWLLKAVFFDGAHFWSNSQSNISTVKYFLTIKVDLHVCLKFAMTLINIHKILEYFKSFVRMGICMVGWSSKQHGLMVYKTMELQLPLLSKN